MKRGITSTCYKERKYDKRTNKFTIVWRLDINGTLNVKKFLKEIPIRNINHLRRLKKLRIV